jgi:hypothetical protein
MNEEQKQLFRMILTEALTDITEKEFADLIDTFIALYESKFGKIELVEDDSDEEPELLHTREANEYLKKFQL